MEKQPKLTFKEQLFELLSDNVNFNAYSMAKCWEEREEHEYEIYREKLQEDLDIGK